MLSTWLEENIAYIWKKIEAAFSENPKLFWSYHKPVLHHGVKPNSVITYNGIEATTPAEKADLFNSYFSSVFTPPSLVVNNDISALSHQHRSVMQMPDMSLSINEVANCLATLDTSKACGPDNIPPRLLKECNNQISPSLCALFNLSLRTARIPSEWKKANVTPVHKEDSMEPAENYRPISLLCILSKVLERCVNFTIMLNNSSVLSSMAFLKSLLRHTAVICS